MTTDDLRKQVRLVLSQYKPTVIRFGSSQFTTVYSVQRFYSFPTDPLKENKHSTVNEFDEQLDRYIAAPGEALPTNEQVMLLKRLFSAASPELQAAFVAVLVDQLRPETAGIVVHTLVDIGRLGDLHGLLGDEKLALSCREPLWKALADKLSLEAHLFSDKELSQLRALNYGTMNTRLSRMLARGPGGEPIFGDEAARRLQWTLDRVPKRIERIQYLRLRKTVVDSGSPEINADRDVLLARMRRLGFRPDIEASLQQAEREILGATTTLQLNACMDRIRKVYEEIVEDAARVVAGKKSLQPPDPDKGILHFRSWRKLLETGELLSKPEAELTQALYNFLSEEGTHRLTSTAEQVRVSKNLVVELGLMLLGRVEALVVPASPSSE